MTMVALGMLIAFARAEPGAAQALAARPGVLRRSLAVVPALRCVSLGPVPVGRAGRAAGPMACPCCSPGADRPGTSTRCSRWPTRCVRRDPATRITVPRHRARDWRPGWCPSTGYPLVIDPRGAAAAPAQLDLAPAARPAARRGPAARGRRSARARRDVVVGFGGYVAPPAYLAARRPRRAGRHPRAERPARASPTGSARGSRRTSP